MKIPDTQEARSILGGLSNKAAAAHFGCSVPLVSIARREFGIPSPRMKRSGAMVQFNLRIPPDLRDAIDRAAAEQGIDPSTVAREALDRAFTFRASPPPQPH